VVFSLILNKLMLSGVLQMPHMLPSEAAFEQAVSALGIRNQDLVVVYDTKGIFSAARAWW
jgi:thiosulfate/3-mercaptopyruvate sulfurtransferase